MAPSARREPNASLAQPLPRRAPWPLPQHWKPTRRLPHLQMRETFSNLISFTKHPIVRNGPSVAVVAIARRDYAVSAHLAGRLWRSCPSLRGRREGSEAHDIIDVTIGFVLTLAHVSLPSASAFRHFQHVNVSLGFPHTPHRRGATLPLRAFQ